MVFKLTDQNSIASKFIEEIRSVEKQGDRLRFRRNMERLGEIFAYEISKKLAYTDVETETPLGIASTKVLSERIVLSAILRAGLPFHSGLLNYFDEADNAFVSAYRTHHKDGSFEVSMNYVTCPDINDSILIIADPMLATGSSFAKALEGLLQNGRPKEIHFATIIASQFGVDFIRRDFPKVHLWVGDIDEELTAKSYIVPGLGDAGDLCFGAKKQD
jgi:uracil phosphoribosyltransferase